mgnify:CR=1 FL=1
MRDEAAKHGYDLIYLGCEMDISKQQKQIQDFLAKGVVAVAVNPKDSKAIGTAVKECNDANDVGAACFLQDALRVCDFFQRRRASPGS